jgi:pimeloyl-ACP methyl ester carboxylesterase
LWRDVVPVLLEQNYRVIAPDLRGFGESDAPRGTRNYRIEHIVRDVVGLLDSLGIAKAHLVGHDWGAVIGWFLAGEHGDRFHSLTAISVGHPRAYANAGAEQKRKGLYTFLFQLRGLTEWYLSKNDFSNFRKWVRNYPTLGAGSVTARAPDCRAGLVSREPAPYAHRKASSLRCARAGNLVQQGLCPGRGPDDTQ